MGVLSRSHIRHLLIAYLNGELPAEVRDRVTRHLAGCEGCRQALAAEERIAAELRARLPAITAPRLGQLARLWPGVATRIAPGKPRQPPRRVLSLAPTFGMMLTFGLLCALILPLALGSRVSVAEATQPRPVTTTATAAPADATAAVKSIATPSPSAVALASLMARPPTLAPAPTPAAGR